MRGETTTLVLHMPTGRIESERQCNDALMMAEFIEQVRQLLTVIFIPYLIVH